MPADGSTSSPPPALPRRCPRRSTTIQTARTPKRELVRLRTLNAAEPVYERPKTRGDCEWCPTCQSYRDAQNVVALGTLPCGHDAKLAHVRSRPCVFIACAQSLYIDVNPDSGAIKLNFPELEPGEMAASCALDIADRGGASLDAVGVALNTTRERARQIEATALLKLARNQAARLLRGGRDG